MAANEKHSNVALIDPNAEVERWLRDEVGPTFDRLKAEPERVLDAEAMAERMRRLHEARLKAGA